MQLSTIVYLVANLVHLTKAQHLNYTGLDLNSANCVDSSGWSSCRAKVIGTASTCVTACLGAQDCTLACGCVLYQELFNCAGTSCWNEVYSCEYGGLVVQYLEFCPVAASSIPFWPAPDNAPGGCSCNLGKVYNEATHALTENTQCLKNVTAATTQDNVEQMAQNNTACGCCTISSGLSTIYGMCPNTIPSLIGADRYLSLAIFATLGLSWDSCGSTLRSFDCVRDLRFSPPSENSSTFYAPEKFPPNGTQSLFDTGGSLTRPASGPTFTWTVGPSLTYTVTAASVGKGVHTQATGSGSTTAGATGGLQAGTSNTAKAGEGASLNFQVQMWMVTLICIGLAILV